MRLERFGKISMRYARASWQRPYGGEPGKGNEGLGFGDGDGTMTGEITGDVVWANFPRRREDGVWTPNLRGRIVTPDGQDVLISIHGQSVEEVAGTSRRAILARVELTTQEAKYRWVNTCFFVGEGEIDEDAEAWWLTIYVCVNQDAVGPPAIGDEPPARFRQTGRADGTA